jgi:hypothetical protein
VVKDQDMDHNGKVQAVKYDVAEVDEHAHVWSDNEERQNEERCDNDLRNELDIGTSIVETECENDHLCSEDEFQEDEVFGVNALVIVLKSCEDH